MSTVAARPHLTTSFTHEVLLYSGEAEFVAGTVPFILGGVRLGEPVLVVVSAAKIARLREALGSDADAVEFAPMSEVGRNPACIIPAWRDFVARHPGRRLRGIGEPLTPDRSADEVPECQQHEVLLNLAFADSEPWSLLCPYDVSALADEIIDEALRSHPFVYHDGVRVPNTDFRPEVTVEPLDRPLSPPPPGAASLPFGPSELDDVRRFVRRQAKRTGLSAAKTADLVLAVNEVATNSLRHGGGQGRLTAWSSGEGSLVCDVRDAGWITEPLVGREAPPKDRFGGRGVWLANQLCDLVQLRSSPEGTTVRLHMRAGLPARGH